MKLSISNIAWSGEHDAQVYDYLQSAGFTGLEIAPTRIFPETPYQRLAEATTFSRGLKEHFSLTIASMQSIWHGCPENLFGSEAERAHLLSYSKKAIDFAKRMDCPNLVFGCPKNRISISANDYAIAVDFFKELGAYALLHNTVLAIEPNPAIYGTNFITTTEEAFSLVKAVSSKGFLVNLDVGTMVHNDEDLAVVTSNLDLVSHIHISEPFLQPIKHRALHKALARLDYHRFVSIEMKNFGDLSMVVHAIDYIRSVFP